MIDLIHFIRMLGTTDFHEGLLYGIVGTIAIVLILRILSSDFVRTLLGIAIVIGTIFIATREPAPSQADPVPKTPPHKTPLRPWKDVEVGAEKFTANGITSPFDGNSTIILNLPEELREHNTGGMGPRGPGSGSGLCVWYALQYAARWHNEEALLNIGQKMQKEQGGGWPDKVDAMMKRYAPGVKYIQHTGGDEEFLDLAIKTRHIVPMTYCGKDGVHYPMVIGHMVDGAYMDEKQGAILDNNFPKEYLWMSRGDMVHRWRGEDSSGKPYIVSMPRPPFRMPIGGGWAIVILSTDPAPPVLQ